MAEVGDLLGKAEAADQADVPDGMRIPEELARREKRLAEITRAKAVIKARTKDRFPRERDEHEDRSGQSHGRRLAQHAGAGRRVRPVR